MREREREREREEHEGDENCKRWTFMIALDGLNSFIVMMYGVLRILFNFL